VRCLVRGTSQLHWLPVDRVELATASMDDAGSLERAVAGADAVFHLAAVTSAVDPAAYHRVNVEGTARLLDAIARRAPAARLVFCSSQAAAGPTRDGRPLTEADRPAPITTYGASKLAAEQLVSGADGRHVIVRPPAVYGPRDVDILAAFRLARRGLAVRIGPPGQRLAIVHVRDLVSGLLLAATVDHARGIYFVSGGTARWDELVGGIGSAVGRRVRIVAAPPFVPRIAAALSRAAARLTRSKPLLTTDRVRDLVQPDWSCDDMRARRDLGYQPAIALADGLRETAAWYREQGWL
jgi:nucleoside-diphosphate-sugar epimerase